MPIHHSWSYYGGIRAQLLMVFDGFCMFLLIFFRSPICVAMEIRGPYEDSNCPCAALARSFPFHAKNMRPETVAMDYRKIAL